VWTGTSCHLTDMTGWSIDVASACGMSLTTMMVALSTRTHTSLRCLTFVLPWTHGPPAGTAWKSGGSATRAHLGTLLILRRTLLPHLDLNIDRSVSSRPTACCSDILLNCAFILNVQLSTVCDIWNALLSVWRVFFVSAQSRFYSILNISLPWFTTIYYFWLAV